MAGKSQEGGKNCRLWNGELFPFLQHTNHVSRLGGFSDLRNAWMAPYLSCEPCAFAE